MKLTMIDIAYYAKSAICNEIYRTRIQMHEEDDRNYKDILQQDLNTLEDELSQVDDIIHDLSRKYKPNIVMV